MIQIFYEYKEYGNQHSVVFRISQILFNLNKFILLDKDIVNSNLDLLSLFVSLVYIENTSSILIFKDAIVVNRIDEHRDDISLINMILLDFVNNIYNTYTVLDIRSIEHALQPKFLDTNKETMIRSRLMEFIHNEFHELFQEHGGYAYIHSIDNSDKFVNVKLIGKCLGCKYRNKLLSKISDFLQQEIDVSYSVRLAL